MTTITVAQALTTTLTGQSVFDTEANVFANLPGLLAKKANIASIALSDDSPSATITTVQLLADAAILGKISTHYALTVTGAPLTVAQVQTLQTALAAASGSAVSLLLSDVGPHGLTVSDTATNLAALTVAGATLLANQNIAITTTATVAQLTAIQAKVVTATLAPTTIGDTTANLVNGSGVVSTFVKPGVAVTMTTAATIAQLTAIHAANTTGTLTANIITDTAANLFGGTGVGPLSTFVKAGVAVTVTTPATIAQLTAIHSADTTGTVTASTIVDSVANFTPANITLYVKTGVHVTVNDNVADLVAAAAVTGSILTNANTTAIVITDSLVNVAASLHALTALKTATRTVTATMTATAAQLLDSSNASALALETSVTLVADLNGANTVTVAQANTLEAIKSFNTGGFLTISDTAANLTSSAAQALITKAGLGGGVAVQVSDSAKVTVAAIKVLVNEHATLGSSVVLTISDTAANLHANAAYLNTLAIPATITITGTLSATDLATLLADMGNNSSYAASLNLSGVTISGVVTVAQITMLNNAHFAGAYTLQDTAYCLIHAGASIVLNAAHINVTTLSEGDIAGLQGLTLAHGVVLNLSTVTASVSGLSMAEAAWAVGHKLAHYGLSATAADLLSAANATVLTGATAVTLASDQGSGANTVTVAQALKLETLAGFTASSGTLTIADTVANLTSASMTKALAFAHLTAPVVLVDTSAAVSVATLTKLSTIHATAANGVALTVQDTTANVLAAGVINAVETSIINMGVTGLTLTGSLTGANLSSLVLLKTAVTVPNFTVDLTHAVITGTLTVAQATLAVDGHYTGGYSITDTASAVLDSNVEAGVLSGASTIFVAGHATATQFETLVGLHNTTMNLASLTINCASAAQLLDPSIASHLYTTVSIDTSVPADNVVTVAEAAQLHHIIGFNAGGHLTISDTVANLSSSAGAAAIAALNTGTANTVTISDSAVINAASATTLATLGAMAADGVTIALVDTTANINALGNNALNLATAIQVNAASDSLSDYNAAVTALQTHAGTVVLPVGQTALSLNYEAVFASGPNHTDLNTGYLQALEASGVTIVINATQADYAAAVSALNGYVHGSVSLTSAESVTLTYANFVNASNAAYVHSLEAAGDIITVQAASNSLADYNAAVLALHGYGNGSVSLVGTAAVTLTFNDFTSAANSAYLTALAGTSSHVVISDSAVINAAMANTLATFHATAGNGAVLSLVDTTAGFAGITDAALSLATSIQVIALDDTLGSYNAAAQVLVNHTSTGSVVLPTGQLPVSLDYATTFTANPGYVAALEAAGVSIVITTTQANYAAAVAALDGYVHGSVSLAQSSAETVHLTYANFVSTSNAAYVQSLEAAGDNIIVTAASNTLADYNAAVLALHGYGNGSVVLGNLAAVTLTYNDFTSTANTAYVTELKATGAPITLIATSTALTDYNAALSALGTYGHGSSVSVPALTSAVTLSYGDFVNNVAYVTALEAAGLGLTTIINVTAASDSLADYTALASYITAHSYTHISVAVPSSATPITLTYADFTAGTAYVAAMVLAGNNMIVTGVPAAGVAAVQTAGVISYSISDSASNVGTNLASLIADVGHISGVTLTDAVPGTLSYAVSGTDGAGLHTLLGLIGANANVTIALSGTAAALEADYSAGLTGLATLSGFAGVTVTASAVGAADVATLVTDFGSALASVAVSDSAAHVGTNLGALITNVGHISGVTLTDAVPGTLSYAVSGSDGAGLHTLLGRIGANANVTIALSGTAASLEADYTAGLTGLAAVVGFAGVTVTASAVGAANVATLVTDFGSTLAALAISDSAANVATNLGSLITNVGHINGITLTDVAPATLSYTVSGTDGAGLHTLLGLIGANAEVTIALAGTAAALEADYTAGLTGLATLSGFAGVTVTASAVGIADLATLVTDFGSKLAAVAISDSASNVGTNLATLIADVGHISGITLTDAVPATLSYTVTGTDGAGLHTLLGLIVANANVTIALAGTAAELEADYTAGLTGLATLSGFAGVTVTASAVGAADVATLVADFGATLGTLAISDSAAHVGTNLGALITNIAHISGITLTDAVPGTLSYTVSGSDGAGLHTVLGLIGANANVTIALSGTAAALEADYTAGLTGLAAVVGFAGVTVTASAVGAADVATLVTDFGSTLASVAISDSAAHVGTNLGALITNVAHIGSITLTDAVPGTLSYTVSGTDGAGLHTVLGLIGANAEVTIALAGTAASLEADYSAGLTGLAAVSGFAGVTVTASAVSIADVATLVTDFGSTLAAVAISDSATNVATNLATLITNVSHIGSITLTDAVPGTLSYTVTGTDGLGLHTLLGLIVANADVTIALAGTAAELEADYAAGLTGLATLSGFAAVTVTASAVSIADVATLVADFGSTLAAVAISDSAANVGTNLATLITNVSHISGITLTDVAPATLSYTVTGTDGAGLHTLLSLIGANADVTIALSGTAAALEADYTAGLTGLAAVVGFAGVTVTASAVGAADVATLVADFGATLGTLAISDSAAHVGTNLGALITNIAHISGITLTDAVPGTLSYTVSGTDGLGLHNLLGLIGANANVTIALSGTAAALEADYTAGLTGLAALSGFAGVTVTASVVGIADVATLVTDFGATLGALAIADSASNVGTNLATLIADVGHISGVTLTDVAPATLSYTVSGTDGAGLHTLLGLIGANANVTIALAGTAAALEADYTAGLTGLATLSGFAGVTVTASAVGAADVATLVADFGSKLVAVAVSDSAANVTTNLGSLITNVGHISGITLTDVAPATLSYTVTGTDGAGLHSLLGLIGANADVTIALSGTAAALEADYTAGLTGLAAVVGFAGVTVTASAVGAADVATLVTDFGSTLGTLAISDSAAHVGTNLGALITNVAHIGSVTLTDAVPGTLSYTVTGSDGAGLHTLLGRIGTNANVTIALSGTAAALEADYTAGLTGLAAVVGFAGVTVTANTVGIADVATLVTDFGATLGALAIADSASNVGTNLATLIADVGHISGVTLTDVAPATLSYTVSGTDGAGLHTLLGLIGANANVTIALAGTAAALEADYTAGLTGLATLSGFAGVTVTASAVGAADVATLVTDFGSKLVAVAVSDSAANVGTNLGALITNVGHVSGITLTDVAPATLSYTVTGTDGAGLHTVLGLIGANADVTIALAGTAAALEADYTAGLTGLAAVVGFAGVTVTASAVGAADVATLVTDFGSTLGALAVSDTAANVQTAQAALETNISSISSVALSGSGAVLTLNLTSGAANEASLASLIGKLAIGSDTVVLSGAEADLDSAVATIQAATGYSTHITSVVATGPALSVALADTLNTDYGSKFASATLSDTAADFAASNGTAAAGFTQLTGMTLNVTISDSANLAQLYAVKSGIGSGTLTAAGGISDTAADYASVNGVLTTDGGALASGMNATVTGTAANLAQLSAIKAKIVGGLLTATNGVSDTAADYSSAGGTLTTNATVVLAHGMNATVTDIADLAQLTAIQFAIGAGTLTYSNTISDSAANFFNPSTGTTFSTAAHTYVVSGENVTVTGNGSNAADLDQLQAIKQVIGSGTLAYTSISDTYANLHANANAFVLSNTNVTVTDQQTIANLVNLESETTGTITALSIVDTAANVQSNSSFIKGGVTSVTLFDTAAHLLNSTYATAVGEATAIHIATNVAADTISAANLQTLESEGTLNAIDGGINALTISDSVSNLNLAFNNITAATSSGHAPIVDVSTVSTVSASVAQTFYNDYASGEGTLGVLAIGGPAAVNASYNASQSAEIIVSDSAAHILNNTGAFKIAGSVAVTGSVNSGSLASLQAMDVLLDTTPGAFKIDLSGATLSMSSLSGSLVDYLNQTGGTTTSTNMTVTGVTGTLDLGSVSNASAISLVMGAGASGAINMTTAGTVTSVNVAAITGETGFTVSDSTTDALDSHHYMVIDVTGTNVHIELTGLAYNAAHTGLTIVG